MDNESLVLKINDLEHEVGSLKHRMKTVEEETHTIQNLAMSVQELALNMKNMLDEQKEQNKRLSVLEQLPAKRWNSLTTTIITALASGIVGVLAGAVFSLL